MRRLLVLLPQPRPAIKESRLQRQSIAIVIPDKVISVSDVDNVHLPLLPTAVSADLSLPFERGMSLCLLTQESSL